EAAEVAVGPPVLRQLDGRAGDVAAVALELALEPLEERERVGGGAGEAGQQRAVVEGTDLLDVVLEDGVLHRRLAVRAEGDFAVVEDAQDGGRADARVGHRNESRGIDGISRDDANRTRSGAMGGRNPSPHRAGRYGRAAPRRKERGSVRIA